MEELYKNFGVLADAGDKAGESRQWSSECVIVVSAVQVL